MPEVTGSTPQQGAHFESGLSFPPKRKHAGYGCLFASIRAYSQIMLGGLEISTRAIITNSCAVSDAINKPRRKSTHPLTRRR
jgi:hypothetical protein